MKQSDIFSIIIIATVGTLASYFAVNALLGDPNMQSATIKIMNSITATLDQPDPELFNPDAINPTIEVVTDGCQDVDRNGIISAEERALCNNTGGEPVKLVDDTSQTVYCPDGTMIVGTVDNCPDSSKKRGVPVEESIKNGTTN